MGSTRVLARPTATIGAGQRGGEVGLDETYFDGLAIAAGAPTRQAIPTSFKTRPAGTPTARTGPGRPKAAKVSGPARRHASSDSRPKIRCTRVGDEPMPWPNRLLLADEITDVTDPGELCGAVVRGAVEVLAGTRSLQQLRAWVTPQVFGQLRLRAELERDKPRDLPTAHTGVVRVRKVVLNRIGDHAEATVLVDTADRVRAAAARLAMHKGEWRVCVLELA